MARGRSQNFINKRQRKQVKTNPESKGLDVVLESSIDKLFKPFKTLSNKIYEKNSKFLAIATIIAFGVVYLTLEIMEKKITKYTYKYENISEIKYKSIYNGHYNYNKDHYETFDAMQEGGRKIYYFYNLILICLYSPLLCVSISLLISDLCGNTVANLAPFGISFFQVIESIILNIIIKGYPNKKVLLTLSGKVAVFKYFFIFFCIMSIIFGGIDSYKAKQYQKFANNNNNVENVEEKKKN